MIAKTGTSDTHPASPPSAILFVDADVAYGASTKTKLRLRRITAVMRALQPDIVHLVGVKPVVLGGEWGVRREFVRLHSSDSCMMLAQWKH